MKRMIPWLLCGWLWTPVCLMAHPGHEHGPGFRVWKGTQGQFELDASYVLSRDDRVQLCKHDGSAVWVPLAQLSAADQAWVRNRLREIQGLNGSRAIESDSVGRLENANSAMAAGVVLAVVALVALSLVVRRRLAALPAVAVLVGLGSSLTAIASECLPEHQKTMLAIQKHFEPFKDKLDLRADEDFFYVGSNGLPDHPMMIGIRNWQQQVPMPQPYTGRNAWRIPLRPRLADKPISAKQALFRGAIALAINGVPIFNALNNRGEDAYLAGELDEYGGHCGRGDDYHYHIAPVHLEKRAGKGKPIAYALDGFPLHGYAAADGTEPRDLDAFNGRMEMDGYRYYATRTYPYINGGMRGVVTVRGDQVDPQPRDAPVRPPGTPLRGAKVTDFTRDEESKTFTLKYELRGATHAIKYTIDNGSVTFVFTDGTGKKTSQTYRRRERP